MGQMIKVGMADLKICKAPDALTTIGLGSCIGIAIYDPSTKITGLAHIMLPDSTQIRNNSNIAKFADTGIQKLYDEYKDSEDVVILALNSSEDTNTVHRFIATNKYSMPVGYDPSGSVSNDYNIESLPYSVLIDGKGNIVKVFDGMADYESFKNAIEENRK